MSSIIDKKLLQWVVEIAELAGEVIMEIYNKDFTVEYKADNSPLTQADKEAHTIITRELSAKSHLPILSEEAEAQSFEQRKQWNSYWIVDPIDGTREFVKRNGQFTVNIGLVASNKVQLGVVLRPTTGECFMGIVGMAAWYCPNKGGEWQKTHCRQFPKPGQKLKVLASLSHSSIKLQQHINWLKKSYAVELNSVGSSLKICLIAIGESDLYLRLGPTSEWDTAAAQAVLQAAGGEIINLEDFAPLHYNTKHSLLNPHFVALGSPKINIKKLLQC